MSVSPMMTQCPRCQQEQVNLVGHQRAVCTPCSKALRRMYQFCCSCQREWQGENNYCSLPWCGIRAALLSDAVNTDPDSCVVGCPIFRACPSCKALLMHSGEGCPNIVCQQCHTGFCYRCLKEECVGEFHFDDEDEDKDEDEDEDEDEDGVEDQHCEIYGDYPLPCTIVDNSNTLKELN